MQSAQTEQINIEEKICEMIFILTQMLDGIPNEDHANQRERLLAVGNIANLIMEELARVNRQTDAQCNIVAENFIQGCRSLDESWQQYLEMYEKAVQAKMRLANVSREHADICEKLLEAYRHGKTRQEGHEMLH